MKLKLIKGALTSMDRYNTQFINTIQITLAFFSDQDAHNLNKSPAESV